MREQGRRKTGVASLPHIKLAPMNAPGPIGERQEHLDAIISFAGVGQRRRLFRGLDILTEDVTNPTIPALEHPRNASQDEDSEEMDFSSRIGLNSGG